MKGKWETRWDKFSAWLEKKPPFMQALITTTVIVLGIALLLGSAILIGITMIKTFGWWNILVVPILFLYANLYFNFREQKKERS